MPTYTFKCKCGKKREVDRPITKAPKTLKCKCGKRMKQVFEKMSFILNGSGYYSTSRDDD